MLVLGAAGRLGRRVWQALLDSGVEPVALSRDATPDQVGPGDVVVNVATDAPEVCTAWSRAGAAARGYVGAAHLPDESTRAPGGAAVVPGAGWFAGVGDALAVMAARSLVGADRADVTAWVPSRRSLLARATPRERQALWQAVGRPMRGLVDGEVVFERIAEARRLAWFPRPVGPHHAAGVPGPHVQTLPRVVPSLTTVRTALALRSSSAELLQALGSMPLVRDRLQSLRSREVGTADERWAIVAEVTTPAGTLVRGWANGHDRHGVTAQVITMVALGLDADRTPRDVGGPLGVTEVIPAEELLDGLASLTDLRWSVTTGQ